MIAKIFQQILYPFIWLFLKIFLNHKVVGLENLKDFKNKAVIFIAPHKHWLDPIIYGYSLPFNFAPIHFIAAEEYFNFFKGNPAKIFAPIVALYVRVNGSIPVKRGDRTITLEKKLKKAIEVLKNNGKIWIFPEGKIIKEKNLGEFKIGVVFLHQQTNVPIVPVIGLINGHLLELNLKTIFDLFLRKKRLLVKFGEPIYELPEKDLEKSAQFLRNKVIELKEEISEKGLPPEFWSKYFQVYDILNMVPPYKDLLNKILSILDPQKGEKILDAGAGTGNLAVLIENKSAQVIALDFSKEALEIYKNKNPNATICLHDLTKPLPFDDNYFDKIVSNNVIYNIPREKRLEVIKELKRVLKPGGLIVISNIHKNFSPLKIYLASIKESIKKDGLLKTIYLVIKLIIPTIKMFYYNFKIQKVHQFDRKNLFDFEEQKELLIKAGFKYVSQTEFVYANQAILNYAIK
jgi:1-acyl-sn-glycerol-3-phosphate acyltransferase